MTRRSRIAFLTAQLEFDDTYPDILVREALAAAERRNCDLLVVPGREWGLPYHQEGVMTAVYQSISQWPVDAVIVSPPVTNRWGPERLPAAFNALAPLPIIAMGVNVGSTPRVDVETTQGLSELIRHLIQVHGRRRIVCLRGPRHHEVANQRFQIWRSVLAEAGLPNGDDWVAEVEFREEGVGPALSDLIDRQGTIDAVVAASDLVALAAIEELKRRDWRVPQDVSVVGYDNLPHSATSSVPLSTVDQAIDRQVDAAFDLAQATIRGRGERTLRVVEATAVFRHSCGCEGQPVPTESAAGSAPASLLRRLERLTTFHMGLSRRSSQEELVDWLSDQLPHQGFDRPLLFLQQTEYDQDPTNTLLPAPRFGPPVLGGGLPKLWGRERRSRVVLPLASGRQWFGLLVLDLTRDGALIYRGLQEALTRRLRDDFERDVLVSRMVEQETAKRVEQEKMRALGTLVAGLAHEVNTPLGNAITAASYLEEVLAATPALRSDAFDALRLLQKNLDRAADLVSRFKRLSVDRTHVPLRRFDLEAFLSDLRSGLAFSLRRHGIELEIDVSPPLSVVSSSAVLFDVFSNLAQNAIEHAYPEGGPGLVLLSASRSSDGDLLLTFRDHGRGMSPEIVAQIFTPFFTTRRGQGGTGLGLHMVYNWVHESLGGRIECVSKPGEGTEFRITLPDTDESRANTIDPTPM